VRQDVHCPERQHDAERDTDGDDDRAFGEDLIRNRPTRRAERDSNRNVAAPSHSSREKHGARFAQAMRSTDATARKPTPDAARVCMREPPVNHSNRGATEAAARSRVQTREHNVISVSRSSWSRRVQP